MTFKAQSLKFHPRATFCLISVTFISTDETKTVSRTNIAIESFPDEILIEIFVFLSVKDLKRIMLVGRVFSDIVGQSTRLMQRFLLKVSPKRKWDFQSLTSFQRVHRNAKILDFKFDDESIRLVVDGMLNIGRNFKFFELHDCEISTENLAKLLNSMKQLTRLDLINAKVSGDLQTDSTLPELENLQQLNVVESQFDFQAIRKARNLLAISIQVDDRKSLNLEAFEKLLHQLNKLKTLKLSNIRLANFLNRQQSFSFQLTTLTIHRCHFREKESLESFLDGQQMLEEVEMTISDLKLNLDRLRYFEDSLATGVVRQKHLKRLTLSVENYNFANFNFLHQCMNENVENLSLSLEQTSCPVKSILQAFPNVQQLELSTKDELDEPSLDYINANCQRLETFKVTKHFGSETFGKLKVKNLKCLHVNEANIEQRHWMEFLSNSPNITKLVLNFSFFMDLSEDFIDLVTKSLKLEHLELIDKWIGMRNDVYVKICENSRNLKYLKLWNINVEKDFDEADRDYLRSRNIRFHLYNDESLNSPMVPF